MTRVQIAEQLQLHFNNSVYYTTQDLNESIQDGLDECVAFTGCILSTALLPFEANLTYYDLVARIPNYIGVISIFNQVTNRWLSPTSLRKLEAERPDWDCTLGTPEWFVPINFRYIAICRKPSASNYGNMLIYYRAAAPVLSDTLQIPIPADHSVALLDYCETDLAEQAQEWTKAGLNFKNYIQSLDALRVAIQSKENPGRLPSLK